MNKMLTHLNGYKREAVLAPLFKMLEATFDLFVPLVMADIVNVGIAAHDFHYILVRCGILLLLAVVGLACSLTAQYFSAKAAVGYSTSLRHALFEHIQRLGFTEMDTMGTSTLITRMTSDINQVQSGLNLFLRLFLRSPFVVVGAMVMAFTVNVRAAWIFVVAIPLLSVVVFGVMVITNPLYKTAQARLDRVLGLTRENLTGVRVVLPSFVIILLVAAVLRSVLRYAGVQAVLDGVRPCVVAMILATAVTMGLSTLGGYTAGPAGGFAPDGRAIAVFVLLGLVHCGYKKIRQKAPSPIGMILLSAVLGIVFWH